MAIAATTVSARVNVRPFCLHSFFSFPASRAPEPVKSWHSSSPRNASVGAVSPGRIPPYTSAMLRAVVERVWPARTSSARSSRRPFRRRRTSIKTDVSRSSFTFGNGRASLGCVPCHAGHRFPYVALVPRPPNRRSSLGDHRLSKPVRHSPGIAVVFCASPLLARFPPGRRYARAGLPSCRCPGAEPAAGGCEFFVVS